MNPGKKFHSYGLFIAGKDIEGDGWVYTVSAKSLLEDVLGPVPEEWIPLSPAPPGAGEEGSLMVMKVYSPEFKADAVALYLSDPSHTFEGIGKDLGISREMRIDQTPESSGHAHLTAGVQEHLLGDRGGDGLTDLGVRSVALSADSRFLLVGNWTARSPGGISSTTVVYGHSGDIRKG
jgi:hypothetical protein